MQATATQPGVQGKAGKEKGTRQCFLKNYTRQWDTRPHQQLPLPGLCLHPGPSEGWASRQLTIAAGAHSAHTARWQPGLASAGAGWRAAAGTDWRLPNQP